MLIIIFPSCLEKNPYSTILPVTTIRNRLYSFSSKAPDSLSTFFHKDDIPYEIRNHYFHSLQECCPLTQQEKLSPQRSLSSTLVHFSLSESHYLPIWNVSKLPLKPQLFSNSLYFSTEDKS